MSFRRKTYDGDGSRRYVGPEERGDSFNSKSKIDKPSAPKRTIKDDGIVDPEESPFFESGEKDRYLITYADLITLLLGLFIILYAVSNVDAHKYKKMISAMGDVFGNKVKVITVDKTIKPVDTQSESALKTRLVDVIKKYHYENSIRLEENSRGIVIHILDDILFPSGQADISSGSEIILSRLAQAFPGNGVLMMLYDAFGYGAYTYNVIYI